MICRIFMLLALLLLSAPARAEGPDAATRGSARNLGDEANRLFAEGNYAAALDKYERAGALVRVPTLGVRAARCLEKLGRWIEAAERYLAVTRMQLDADALPVHHEAQAQAAAEREALVPRIPRVVVELGGVSQGVSVSIDGKGVPAALIGQEQLIDPGEHRLEAQSGERVQTRTFTATEGQTSKVMLHFGEPSPTSPVPTEPERAAPEPDGGKKPGSTQRMLGFVVAGAGALGLVAGGITGLVASGQRSKLERQCGAELECPPAAWEDADSYNGLRTVSGATLIGGALCLAAGSVLYFTAPRASVAPLREGRGGALRFRF